MTVLAAPAFLHRPAPSPLGSRTRIPVGLQIVLYAVILIYAAAFQQIRFLGVAALAAVAGAAALLWIPIARRFVQPPLIALAGVGAIYAVISYLGILHWDTLLFAQSAILQQCVYVFLLPILVPVFAYYHERVFLREKSFVYLDNAVFLLCCAVKIIPLLYGYINIGAAQLVNTEALFAFMLVRKIFYVKNVSVLLRFFLVFLVAITAASFQSVLVMGFLLALVVMPKSGVVWLRIYIFGLTLIALVAIPFANPIWNLDHNTGIRLFFWHDVIERVLSSWGIGQGFGTETIRPSFALDARDVVISSLESESFIMVGSHNAFFDAVYRMGVLGGGLLIYYFSDQVRSVLRGNPAGRSFDQWVVACLFTLLMVNVGLVSINFLLGSTFLMGWLAFRISTNFASERRAPKSLALVTPA